MKKLEHHVLDLVKPYKKVNAFMIYDKYEKNEALISLVKDFKHSNALLELKQKTQYRIDSPESQYLREFLCA